MGALLETGGWLSDAWRGVGECPKVTLSKRGACGEGSDKKDLDETCTMRRGVELGGTLTGGRKCGIPGVGFDGWGVEKGSGVGGGDEEG